MKRKTRFIEITAILFFCLTTSLLAVNTAWAHCDTLDGPVVKAAQKALETGNVHLVLIWVQQGDETETKKAFEKARAIRKLSSEAKEFADMYFFETLVRIHRAGEGAPYTGLKPAAIDQGPVIPAADRAVVSGNIDPVLTLLTENVQKGVRERFKQVVEKKNFKTDDVQAGRVYVEAYVMFMHSIEGIYESTMKASHGHRTPAEEDDTHEEAH